MNALSFLDAIREDPADDTSRLIFADWLDDNDNSDRAEFIRTQIELAKGVRDRGRSFELQQRLRDLLQHNRQGWLGPLAHFAPDAMFERGFVHKIGIDTEDFLSLAEEILDAHPITALRLRNAGPFLRDLANCRFLDRVHTLDLSGSPISDEGASALGDSGYLRGLQHLHVDSTNLTPLGVQLLVATPRWRSLKTLSMSANNLGDDGVRFFTVTLSLNELERLDLGNNLIGPRGAERLAQCSRLASLSALRLFGNPLGIEGVETLAASEYLANTKTLDVTGCVPPEQRVALRNLAARRLLV